jgi:hypothetical protein
MDFLKGHFNKKQRVGTLGLTQSKKIKKNGCVTPKNRLKTLIKVKVKIPKQ